MRPQFQDFQMTLIIALGETQQAFSINTPTGCRDIIRYQNHYYTRLRQCFDISEAHRLCQYNDTHSVPSLILNHVPPQVWIQLEGTVMSPRLSQWIRQHHGLRMDPFEFPEVTPNPLMQSHLKWLAATDRALTLPTPTSPLILVVEEHRQDGSLMGQLVRDLGYQYLHVQDSTLALPLILEHQPDLIGLSLNLGGLTGYDLCERIRCFSQFQTTPILLIRQRHDYLDRHRALSIQASGLISKPIQKETLAVVLRRFLVNKDPVNPVNSEATDSDPYNIGSIPVVAKDE